MKRDSRPPGDDIPGRPGGAEASNQAPVEVGSKTVDLSKGSPPSRPSPPIPKVTAQGLGPPPAAASHGDAPRSADALRSAGAPRSGGEAPPWAVASPRSAAGTERLVLSRADEVPRSAAGTERLVPSPASRADDNAPASEGPRSSKAPPKLKRPLPYSDDLLTGDVDDDNGAAGWVRATRNMMRSKEGITREGLTISLRIHPHPAVRAFCADELRRMGDPRALDDLRSQLAVETHPVVERLIFAAIGKIEESGDLTGPDEISSITDAGAEVQARRSRDDAAGAAASRSTWRARARSLGLGALVVVPITALVILGARWLGGGDMPPSSATPAGTTSDVATAAATGATPPVASAPAASASSVATTAPAASSAPVASTAPAASAAPAASSAAAAPADTPKTEPRKPSSGKPTASKASAVPSASAAPSTARTATFTLPFGKDE